MIRQITERELERRVGELTLIESEGTKGNFRHPNGNPVEGKLCGILQKDEKGFYVRMFDSREINGEYKLDKKRFNGEVYRLQYYDLIRFITPKRKTFGAPYSVRVRE